MITAQNGVFKLDTAHTSYVFRLTAHGHLEHIYYGKKMEYCDLSYSAYTGNVSFSPNPNEGPDSWRYSNNHVPQELSVCGIGDFRINALALRNHDGSLAADPRFVKAEIIKGKYSIFVQCAQFGCLTGWSYFKPEEIIAWCKLSDIEPYK